MQKKRRTVLLLPIIGACFYSCLLLPPQSSSVDIPINATVLNSLPVVLDLEFEDTSLDPNSPFQITVEAGDNNTLADIREVRLDITNVAADGYSIQLVWSRTGFHALEGKGSILLDNCQEPQDITAAIGTWIFSIKLPGDVPSGSWRLKAIVSDEEGSSETETILWINSFISVSLTEPSKLNLSIMPGVVGGSSGTLILLTYTSNEGVDLLARSTSFVGVVDPSFEIPSSAIEISSGQGNPIPLSESLSEIALDLPAGKDEVIQLMLLVRIPQPFYDQDYEGLVTIVLSPS